MTPEQLKDRICQILDDKKAENIKILAVADQTSVADYFVVCSSKSQTHVKAIAEYVEDTLAKEDGLEPCHKEGMRSGKWTLVDYGSVIVHVFEQNTRMYYCLEKLWGNGENISSYPAE